jgi:hypothetical protein
MSTIQTCTMHDRVVLIYDTPEQTIISELDIEQASVLLEQLQDAVQSVLAGFRERAVENFPSRSLLA